MEKLTQRDFLNSMLSNLSVMEDKSPNSFSYDVLSATAIVFDEQERKIFDLLKKFDVDNLEDEELEKRVFQITGLTRKQPTQATGKVTITGTPGTIIPLGTTFLAGSTEFLSIEEKQISDAGQVEVLVRCKEFGATGDVVPNSITKTKVPISGVSDIYNNEEFYNGYDEETDDDLRERYYDKLANPPKAGNPAHYKLWTTEVDGIWTAKVFRTYNGPGTVRVVIVGQKRDVVNDLKIKEVFDHIMEEAPIQHENLLVESAKEKMINVSAKLKITSGFNFADIKDKIKSNISDYLFNITFKQNFVSFAKVGEQILKVAGVEDYSDLTLNLVSNNTILADDEIPILGKVEVNIT